MFPLNDIHGMVNAQHYFTISPQGEAVEATKFLVYCIHLECKQVLISMDIHKHHISISITPYITAAETVIVQ